MFTEAFEDILRGHCTGAQVRAIEAGGPHDAMWEAIAGSGFLDLMAPEDASGAGLDLAGALPIFTALGAHAVPLPVGQAIALRTLLPAGQAVPPGLPTFAPALRRESDGAFTAPRVPHGTQADHVLAEHDGALWLLDAHAAQRRPAGIHGEATADLHWPAAAASAARPLPQAVPPGRLAAWGAALHAALLAGALQRSFEMTLQYGNDRVQFGKSIGKFQAVQHQLAVMAEHVAAARMAVAGAFAAGRSGPAMLPAAIAKARTSEAATVAATTAHAVHGAIGITEEYDLQLFTRRLHTWRLAHGSEAHWHRVVGQALLDAPGTPAGDFVRGLQAA
ncbi:acyl-CoA dehydrogenase family protein [Xenophilus azovorans]|uniref:acyl-CoA dehydrogenase family protein n=1 Tax=Xenophilus azovorans TaxID=151755 RepID=UPI0005705B77|nr:acyl-CoA dehydrogenase family protein [Xenophilus azovorans]